MGRRKRIVCVILAFCTLGASLGAAVATARSSAVTWPTVRQGASGERVRTVQYLLNARGFTDAVDGTYGKDTAAAVKRFQRARMLADDGVVGPKTWAKLVVVVKRGSKGSAVKAVQSQLRQSGYKLAVDGLFGAGTEADVKSFQRKHGLQVDGIVGQATWMAFVHFPTAS